MRLGARPPNSAEEPHPDALPSRSNPFEYVPICIVPCNGLWGRTEPDRKIQLAWVRALG